MYFRILLYIYTSWSARGIIKSTNIYMYKQRALFYRNSVLNKCSVLRCPQNLPMIYIYIYIYTFVYKKKKYSTHNLNFYCINIIFMLCNLQDECMYIYLLAIAGQTARLDRICWQFLWKIMCKFGGQLPAFFS